MRYVAALVGCFLMCSAPQARADDATEARFHDALGRDAYGRRRFDDALAHFLDAHAAAASPTSAYNVALAADLAGHSVLAFHFFEEYLAAAERDDGERREEAVRRRDALARRLALVRIETEPAGAAIQVDRAELGDWGTTPRTIAVPPGTRRVVLTLADHEEVSLEVEAAAGALRTARATLPRRVGGVLVEADPPEARVTVTCDGETVATGPASTPIDVPVGSCVVRIDSPGRRSVERSVTVLAGTETRVALYAPPLPIPRGRVLVRTTEAAARVRIDGSERGTTPLVLRDETAGQHLVELEAEGYVPWRGEVTVREGRSTYLNVTLTPAR